MTAGTCPIPLTRLKLVAHAFGAAEFNKRTAMNNTLREFIASTPIVDVHEHHIPEIFLAPDVNLLQLFQQSYAGWTQARPYSLPSETRDSDPMLAQAPPTTWESLVPYLEGSGSNSLVRNLVSALTELYPCKEITRENWQDLDAAVRERHRQPGWCREVMRRAGVEQVITDPYSEPLLDAHRALGPEYHSVCRINAFAVGWHPSSRDHNGNSAHELLRRLDLKPASLDDYLDALRVLVGGLATRHQVALKNALAYDRAVAFDPPDEPLARRAWGQPSPTAEERKAFGDLVVDRLCAWAGERDVPVQMHLGTGILRGSHPLNAAGLIERHPRTRFLLMHLAYPWSRDLLGMAFIYRNIWLDLTWSFLLSPSHFKLALHEAIEVLPDESRLMLGGDN
jgi:uncharacterized protein